MNETTTTVLPLGETLRTVNQWAWRAIPVVAVLLVVALVWRARHDRRTAAKETGKPRSRWVWHDDGSVTGPWLAKRRIRKALAPYVHVCPWPGQYEGWEDAGERRTARRARMVRRAWPDIAEALDWPSRFDSYAVGPLGRGATVAAQRKPDTDETARRLYELRVRTRRTHVGLNVLDDEAGLQTLSILDVIASPVERPAQGVEEWETTTVFNGQVVAREQHREHRGPVLYLVTGTRYTSLYEPDATWTWMPDMDTIDAYADEFTNTAETTTPPERTALLRGETLVRGGGGGVPANRDTAPQRVVLTQRQGQALAYLAAGSEPVTVNALAMATGVSWDRARTRLGRLLSLGLAARTDDGRWLATDEGRALLDIDPPAPASAPWPAPTNQPLEAP